MYKYIIIALTVMILAVSPAYAEKIKLTNAQIETIINGSTIAGQQVKKIMMNISDQNDRLQIYKAVVEVMSSKEAQAYQQFKVDLVNKFNEEQKAKPEKERKQATFANIPELATLVKKDSGLEIDKIKISNKKLNSSVTVEDMLAVNWLFEFVE
jgi:hypothetical protein